MSLTCRMTLMRVVASASAFGPTLAGAQVCAGFPSLSGSRFRVTAQVATYAYATAFGASFTMGKAVFGTGGIGWTRDPELRAVTFDLRVESGLDVVLDAASRVSFCPLLALAGSLRPATRIPPEQASRYLDAGVGAGVAVVAVRSPWASLRVAGSVRVHRLTVWRLGQPAEGVLGWHAGDVYAVWSLGVGLGFRDVLTLRPGVSVPTGLVPASDEHYFAVPFGRREGEVALEISAGFSFGRRERGAH